MNNFNRQHKIARQMIRIIHTVLLENIHVFDQHNYYYSTQLCPEDINIVKVITNKSLKSCKVYYYIDSKHTYDKQFIVFNKHHFLKPIKRKLKLRYCPNITFKYDENYDVNCLQNL